MAYLDITYPAPFVVLSFLCLELYFHPVSFSFCPKDLLSHFLLCRSAADEFSQNCVSANSFKETLLR